YLGHLTDDGLVTFTRWGVQPPRESLRLVALAIEALSQLGEKEAWRHVIVGRAGAVEGWGAQDTVVVTRKPLSDADIGRARGLFQAAAMEAVYLPDAVVKNPFYDLLHSQSPGYYEHSYTFDISPVTDNRPFFY